MERKEEFLLNCIVLDTETTNREPREAEVTELGYVTRNDGDWVKFSELHKPSIPISPEISAVTNITDRMVMDKRNFKDAVPELSALLDAFGGEAVCIAHNGLYDQLVLKNYGLEYPTWICTLRMAKKLYNDDPTVGEFNLAYLRYRFGVLDPADHVITAHRAESDVLVTALLLELFIDEMEKRNLLDADAPYFPQIMQWLAAPIYYKTMQFGKHKGLTLEEVPLSYWKWALNNLDYLNEEKDNYDMDFAASVALVIEKQL